MNNELNKIVKNFSGNVICIGTYSNLIDLITKNEHVINCDILSNDIKETKKKSFFKNKSININKIKKIYKKKNIDYIICNYEVIYPYIRKFVKNSVYINKNKLYFYGKIDTDLIKRMYGRYNTKIDIKEYKKDYIIEIDNSKAKNNCIKEIFYFIKDTFTFMIEIIGDILMG